jgi:hypothetical protein
LKTAFAGFFKQKKMERLEELFDALDTDEPGEAVHYTLLFEDDNELSQGMLAETLKSQHLTERLEMMQVGRRRKWADQRLGMQSGNIVGSLGMQDRARLL